MNNNSVRITKPRLNGFRCLVRSCLNRTMKKNISFFRVPKEEGRSKKWLEVCHRQDIAEKSLESLYKSHRICSVHFEERMYTSPEKNRLLPSAMPTLHLYEGNLQVTRKVAAGKLGNEVYTKSLVTVTDEPHNEIIDHLEFVSVNTELNSEEFLTAYQYPVKNEVDPFIEDPGGVRIKEERNHFYEQTNYLAYDMCFTSQIKEECPDELDEKLNIHNNFRSGNKQEKIVGTSLADISQKLNGDREIDQRINISEIKLEPNEYRENNFKAFKNEKDNIQR